MDYKGLVVALLGWALLQAAAQTAVPSRNPPRNTQWFEDTIDDFLRSAQESGDATDIQVSTCKISSQQLVATAQATAARVLKGVCNPTEIEDRFHNMETLLGDQLNVLKTMLISLEDKIVEQDQELKRQHKRLMGVVAAGGGRRSSQNGGGSTTVVDSSPAYTPAYIPSVPHRAEEITAEGEDEDSGGISPRSGPRFDETSKYNSTVHIENGKRVFSYYWQVNGMGYKLKSWNLRRALRSNNFYIYPGGYRMYLKIIPRYTVDTTYIHTGLTKGDHDEGLSWPFRLKLRLTVLSLEDETGSSDLKSRLWDPTQLCSGTNWRKPVVGDNPECLGLGFPHAVILGSEFVEADRLIMKLTVELG